MLGFAMVIVCCLHHDVLGQSVSQTADVDEKLNQVETNTTKESDTNDVKIDILEFKNEDIHEVLEMIARKGRLNIITGPSVTGKVSIFLKEVDARDALRIILDANDLAYQEDNGIIRVLTAAGFEERYGYPFKQSLHTKMIPLLHADPDEIIAVLNQMKSDSGKIIFNDQSKTFVLIDEEEQVIAMDKYIKKVDVPVDRLTVELKHIDPQKAADIIQPMLSEEEASLEIDEEKKSITVVDSRTKIQEIKTKIEEIDQIERNVEFDVNILQIILNDEHTKGVDWEAIVSDYQNLDFLGLKNAIEGKNGIISLGTVTAEDYVVLKEALETVGDISNLDDDNKKADIGQAVVLSVNGLDAVNLSEQKSTLETKDQEEDLRFYLKPLSFKEDTVDVHIKPEVFSLAEKTTNIVIQDGSTIVIGGLFKNVTVQKDRKIPLLGDIPLIRDVPFSEIPLLGFAFRNQKKSIRKTELIVFITTKMSVEDK